MSGTGETGPDDADWPFGPSFPAGPVFEPEPPPAPFAGEPAFADEPAPFRDEPAFGAEPTPSARPPAEPRYDQPAPGTPPPFAAEPEAGARLAPEPAAAEDDTDALTGNNGGSPIVFGVHCKNGHFTDPDAPSCVVCGTGMRRRSAAPERGPRPALGVLILEDGATVDVDGDYIVGRDPARDESVSAGAARPLRVVDAESTVSRIHAGVHLDGWQVLLTDLGSANGTRVRQPGAKVEQMLNPRVPMPLQHGAQIFVGASCLRYERVGG